MIGWTGLLSKGFDLASNFLGFLREGNERTLLQTPSPSVPVQPALDTRVLTAIDDVARKLDGVAQDIVGKVSEKLERDELERLASQIKGLKLALEFGDKGMLSATLARIMEQIDYAKNRIAEGKIEWLGPWVIAESIRIVALHEVAESTKAHELVKRLAHDFRIDVLDYTRDYLMRSGKAPWVKISEFVEGKNEDLMSLLASSVDFGDQKVQRAERASKPRKPSSDSAQKSNPRVSAPAAPAASTAPATTVKTALNPSAAWPFPTGSRP